MYPLYFSALLKSKDGKILEEGEACLSEAKNAMEFSGHNIPLLNLWENAEIVRVLGRQELEHFSGKTYLCTKKSFRLTDVPTEEIDAAKRFFEVNTHIPVTAGISPDGSTTFPVEKSPQVGACLRYISPELIKLTAFDPVMVGQTLVFDVEDPALRLQKLAVHVTERIVLKRSTAVLLCSLPALTAVQLRCMETYLTQQ